MWQFPPGASDSRAPASLGAGTGTQAVIRIEIARLPELDKLVAADVHAASGAARQIVDYSATLADGRALPDWLQKEPSGVISGLPPQGLGSIDLRVTILFSDGSPASFAITADAASGGVSAKLLSQGAEPAVLFTEQFTETLTDELSELLCTVD